MIRLRHQLFDAARCNHAIALASEFFSRPDKQEVAIERSPHFRGYSEMRNERDWREQIHFGPERPPSPKWQLEGPNLWPPDHRWRSEILALMRDLESVGREVLNSLWPGSMDPDEHAYTLLKLIHYHASPASERPGVAAHVDFSWITLLLQDDTGGLEIFENGAWNPLAPEPGTLIVTYGELLEFATHGRYRATPHRVRAGSRSRYSLPFFLCPAHETIVNGGGELTSDTQHIHRVLDPLPAKPFVFGEAEWKRKGLGIWCAKCVG